MPPIPTIELPPQVPGNNSPPILEIEQPESLYSFHNALPVSHKIAITIDAFVLFITIAALISLAIYIRRQYRKRQTQGWGLVSGVDSIDEEELGEAEGDEWRKGKFRNSPRGKLRKGGKSVRWASLGESEFEGGEKRVVVRGMGSSSPGKRGHKGKANGCWGLDPDFGERGGDGWMSEGPGRGASREERERWKRVGERVRAGYDGFRGN